MRRLLRLVPPTLGVFFLATAAMKALTFHTFMVQVSYYGVASSVAGVRRASCAALLVESVVAVALLLWPRLRTAATVAALVLLAGFSGLIAYGWAYRGLEECGCFGGIIESAPGPSLAKNALLALLAIAWLAWGRRARLGGDQGASPDQRKPARARGWRLARLAFGFVMVGALVALAAAGSSRDLIRRQGADPPGASSKSPERTRPTRAVEHLDDVAAILAQASAEDLRAADSDLALIAYVSDSCERCAETMEGLNALSACPDLPPLCAGILTENSDIEAFRKRHRPDFPAAALDPVAFFSRIDRAPPGLVLVSRKRVVAHWDEKMPPPVEVLERCLEEAVRVRSGLRDDDEVPRTSSPGNFTTLRVTETP